jgi:hypothetical protein
VKRFATRALRFPKRSYGGAWDGKLVWGNLTHSRVCGLLRNPCYAGTYGKGSSIHILPRLIWAGDAVCCGKWPWTESTMKTQSELTGREQQYLGHLRGAQARQLTLAQYCRAQGLSAQSLYRVSHRLARKGILWHREEVAKKPQPAGKFLAVRVAAPAAVGTVCRLQHPNGWVMECASWPEASWLSQFVTGGSHATP